MNGTDMMGTGKTRSFPARKGSVQDTAVKSGEAIIYALGGALLGAAVGKFSVIPGIAMIAVGTHKNMPNITTAGATMALSAGYNRKNTAVNGLDGEDDNYGTDGVGGFNVQNLVNGAKARVGNWVANFAEKVSMKSTSAVGGGSAQAMNTPSNPAIASGQATAGLDALYDLPAMDENNFGRSMEAVIGNVAGFNGFGNFAEQGNAMMGVSASM